MKITFLGTSHGYAEKKRFTSATLIETSEYSYLLDAGAPVEWIMVNKDKSYDKIRGIFITHMHNDHVGSLSAVIEPMLRFRYNNNATCFFPSENGRDGFLRWLETMHVSEEKVKSTVNFAVTKEGKIFDNGDIIVSAKPTMHLGNDSAAFSYIFEEDGKKCLFTGDMGQGFPEYSQLVGNEHYDLVVCEMAHAKLCDVAEKLKNTNTDHMIITHYYMPQMEGYEEILKTFSFPVEVAADGLEEVL